MPNPFGSKFDTIVQGVKLRYKAAVYIPGVNTFQLKAKAINDGDIIITRLLAGDNLLPGSFGIQSADRDFRVEIHLQVDEQYCAALREKPINLILDIQDALDNRNASHINEDGEISISGEHWELLADIRSSPRRSKHSQRTSTTTY